MGVFGSIYDFVQIFFGWRNFALYQNFASFLSSTAIGTSKLKIWYRFNDLNKILRCAPTSLVVAELGQGSSTFFFLGSKRVHKVFSLEENEKYSLRINSPKLTTIISGIDISKFGDDFGTKYLNSHQYLNISNFIYLDGPVSNKDTNGIALPNLDCLEVSLSGKVIAIDCRTNTVRLLAAHLRNSHILVPSKSVISECVRFSINLPEIQSESKRQDIKDLHGELVRTSVFFPMA